MDWNRLVQGLPNLEEQLVLARKITCHVIEVYLKSFWVSDKNLYFVPSGNMEKVTFCAK